MKDYPEVLNSSSDIEFQDFSGKAHCIVTGELMNVGHGTHPEPYIFVTATDELFTNFSTEDDFRDTLRVLVNREY